jgi:hypothetical protein
MVSLFAAAFHDGFEQGKLKARLARAMRESW